MNKVVVVFKGNPAIEANLPLDVVPWSYVGINGTCEDCTMNAMAAQGYMEAKNATNNWELTRARYAGAGLVSLSQPLALLQPLIDYVRFMPLLETVWEACTLLSTLSTTTMLALRKLPFSPLSTNG